MRRQGERLIVEIPGPEHWLFPELSASPGAGFLKWFGDHLDLDVRESGEVRYRMRYWTRGQILVHLLITASFGLELFLRGSEWGGVGLLPLALMANLLPYLLVHGIFAYVKFRILGPVAEALCRT